MSDKIFRYSPVRFGQLEVDANGAFVFYADVAPLEARIEELTKERDDLAQYHGGHYPNCRGWDDVDHRCDCGYLQGEAYRELVDKIAEQAAEIERLHREGK